MKRILFCTISLFLVSIVAFPVERIRVKSGDVLILAEDVSATVTFDYSKMTVNSWSLEEYMADQGGSSYQEKWNKWLKGAEGVFVQDFNKRNRGMRLRRSSKQMTEYNMIVRVTSLETGQTAKGLLMPSFNFKPKSPAQMKGTVEIRDSKNTLVCVLALRDIHGVDGLNTSSRMSTMFLDLSKRICKLVSKAGKEGFGEDEEEDEEDNVKDDEEEDDEVKGDDEEEDDDDDDDDDDE